MLQILRCWLGCQISRMQVSLWRRSWPWRPRTLLAAAGGVPGSVLQSAQQPVRVVRLWCVVRSESSNTILFRSTRSARGRRFNLT
eukprot:4467942-Prymnesium_polylepis.1